jgi:hypothetical protein
MTSHAGGTKLVVCVQSVHTFRQEAIAKVVLGGGFLLGLVAEDLRWKGLASFRLFESPTRGVLYEWLHVTSHSVVCQDVRWKGLESFGHSESPIRGVHLTGCLFAAQDVGWIGLESFSLSESPTCGVHLTGCRLAAQDVM